MEMDDELRNTLYVNRTAPGSYDFWTVGMEITRAACVNDLATDV
jgi:hypothetical protein